MFQQPLLPQLRALCTITVQGSTHRRDVSCNTVCIHACCLFISGCGNLFAARCTVVSMHRPEYHVDGVTAYLMLQVGAAA